MLELAANIRDESEIARRPDRNVSSFASFSRQAEPIIMAQFVFCTSGPKHPFLEEAENKRSVAVYCIL